MKEDENYEIKTYNSDPKIDFDKLQAQIYNSVVEKYTGNCVKAEDLKKRTEEEKFDTKGMFYALTADKKPLAYVRYHYYEGINEMYIGYPWSTPECTENIQEKLFEILLAYVKKKYPEIKAAYMGFADTRIKPFHDFAEKHKMIKTEWEEEYSLNIEKLSTKNMEGFDYRELTNHDLQKVLDVCNKDEMLANVMTQEQLQSYFENKVLKEGNGILLIKKRRIIGSTAALRNYRKGQTLARFQAIDKKYKKYKHLIFVALAKLLVEKKLTDEILVVGTTNEQLEMNEKLQSFGAEKIGGSCRYKMKL